jgi:predicted metalloendopeptidase
MLWRFVRHRANNLDDRFQEAKQQFYYSLFGREQAPSRWKNCVAEVNDHLDMALGAMFVRKYFDEKSKSDVSIFLNSDMKQILSLLSDDIIYAINKKNRFHMHTERSLLYGILYFSYI